MWVLQQVQLLTTVLIAFILDNTGAVRQESEKRSLSLVYASSALRRLNQSQQMTFHQMSEIFFLAVFPPSPLAVLPWDSADWCLPWYTSLLLFLFSFMSKPCLDIWLFLRQVYVMALVFWIPLKRCVFLQVSELFTLRLDASYRFRLSPCRAFHPDNLDLQLLSPISGKRRIQLFNM